MPTLDEGTRVEQHDFGSTQDNKVLSMDDAVDGNIFRRVRGVNSLNKVTGASVEHDTLTADHIQAGSITVDELDVEELSAVASDLGEIVAGIARDADNNFRIDFDTGVISIRDEQDPQELRVRLGVLGAGVEDYGIEVWGPDGTLILGADGLGVAVVGETNLDNDCVSSDKVQDIAIKTIHLDAFAVTASKVGTLDGNGLQINLHATGSNPVLLHDNFRLDADGDATFSGTLTSTFFNTTNAVIGIPGAQQSEGINVRHSHSPTVPSGNSNIEAWRSGVKRWSIEDTVGSSDTTFFSAKGIELDADVVISGDLTVNGETTSGTPSHALGDHDDVDTTGQSGDDVLTYNGVEWVPAAIPAQSTTGVTEPTISIPDASGTTHNFDFEDGLLKIYSSSPT